MSGHNVLGVSYKVNYKALLYCLGILPLVDVIKKLQINFINDLIHIQKSGICLKIIKKDEMAGGIKGLLEEVRVYCSEFNIPDVS